MLVLLEFIDNVAIITNSKKLNYLKVPNSINNMKRKLLHKEWV